MTFVQFNPADFFDVGSINVESTISALNSDRIEAENIGADLRVSVESGFLDTFFQLLLVGYSPALQNFVSTANQAIPLVEAAASGGQGDIERLSQLSASYSIADISSASSEITQVSNDIDNTNATLQGNPVIIPDVNIYYAAAVSEEARQVIRSTLNVLQDNQANLAEKLTNVDALRSQLDGFSEQLTTGAEVAEILAAGITDILPISGPFASTLSATAANLVATYASLMELAARVDTVIGELSKLSATLSNYQAQNSQVIEVYRTASDAEQAQSNFTTSASISDIDADRFSMKFNGNSFDHSGADSPGIFDVGILTVENRGASSTGTNTGNIEFSVQQSVTYNNQTYTYSGTESVSFRYVTTPYDENPITSADAFYINELDISVAVLEGTSANVGVRGSINSPFKIEEFIPLDMNSFISYLPIHYPISDPSFGTDDDDVFEGANLRLGDNYSGLGGNDVINGNDGSDALNGDDGADELNGGSGNDTLNGGNDNDTINGNDGSDDLNGDDGADELNGGNGNDTLNGGDGNDIINGGAGDDLILGTRDSESVDQIYAGDGDDTIISDGNDNIDGGEGFDLVSYAESFSVQVDLGLGVGTNRFGTFVDTFNSIEGVIGSFISDTLVGGNGNDLLDGLWGDDTVTGGLGDDTLIAGPGNDTLVGGSGRDMFEVNPGDEQVLILDFELSIDLIDLSSFALSDVIQALANAQPGSAILTFEDGTVLTVDGDGVTPDTLGLESLILPPNTLPEGDVVITGTATEGETLTADASGVSDGEGIDEATTGFQWQRDGVDIAGATGANYTLTADDIGAEITVVFSYTDNFGEEEALTSAPTAPIASANSPPQVNGGPFNDQVAEGQFFAFGRGSDRFVDPDPDDTLTLSASLANGDPLPAWLSFNPADGFFRGTPPEDAEGIEIRLRATDEAGTVADDVFQLFVSKTDSEPVGQPVIEGTAEEDQTLTVNLTGVTDGDGFDPLNVTIEWFRNDETAPVATAATYTLDQPDVGATIRAEVSFFDGDGNFERLVSDTTEPVANVDDGIVGLMPMSGDGSGRVGQEFTVDTSQLSDEDGFDFVNGNFVIVWRKLMPGGSLITIEGVSGLSYTTTEADVGFTLSALLTYVDDFGTLGGRASFNNATINGLPTGQPLITGRVVLGASLSVDLTPVSDPETLQPATLTYQWLRDGLPIAGANGDTYQVVSNDLAAELTVEVRFEDGSGQEEVVLSAPALPFIPGQLVQGTTNPDTLVGGNGNDTIEGLGSNDTLTGDRADDIIDGSLGIDTAVYSGSPTSYTVGLSASGVTVTDRRADGDGTDQLTNVERLDFEDVIPALGTDLLNLERFGGPAGLEPEALESFIELYIAYFNRAPDAIGLNFWGSRFADGRTLEQIAEQFALSAETQATYPPGTTTQAFVEAVYDNVLGRPADAAGLAFWIDKLDTGVFTRDVFILRTLAGAKSELKPELGEDFVNQQLADRKYLEDKTDIGAYYAVIRGMSDVDDAITAMNLFDGSDASITDAVAAIDGFYADALDPDTGEFLMPLIGVLDDPFAVG